MYIYTSRSFIYCTSIHVLLRMQLLRVDNGPSSQRVAVRWFSFDLFVGLLLWNGFERHAHIVRGGVACIVEFNSIQVYPECFRSGLW